MRQYSREEYSHRDIISKTFVLDIKSYVRNEGLFLFFEKLSQIHVKSSCGWFQKRQVNTEIH